MLSGIYDPIAGEPACPLTAESAHSREVDLVARMETGKR